MNRVQPVFRAGGSAVPGESVTTTVMVDARLQEPSAPHHGPATGGSAAPRPGCRGGLVDGDGSVLRNTGEIRVRPADGALVDATGRVHPAVHDRAAHHPCAWRARSPARTNAQSLRY